LLNHHFLVLTSFSVIVEFLVLTEYFRQPDPLHENIVNLMPCSICNGTGHNKQLVQINKQDSTESSTPHMTKKQIEEASRVGMDLSQIFLYFWEDFMEEYHGQNK